MIFVILGFRKDKRGQKGQTRSLKTISGQYWNCSTYNTTCQKASLYWNKKCKKNHNPEQKNKYGTFEIQDFDQKQTASLLIYNDFK